jgi:uncharacterized protein (DUF58 family)
VRAALRTALLTRRRSHRLPGAGVPHPRRADGYEFAELREYVAGDDPRRIDWAATARAGALQTRVLYEDHALVLGAAIDPSASMRVGRTRSAYDAAVAALVAWYALATGDDRCVRATSQGVVSDARRRGPSAAAVCGSVRDEPVAPFDATLRVAAALVPRDASLLLVSDFFELDAQRETVRALGARFDVTALVVRDPWFDGLPLGGFVRLRDAESGAVRRVFVGRAERARYAAAVRAREDAVCAELTLLGARAAVLDDDPDGALAAAFGLT